MTYFLTCKRVDYFAESEEQNGKSVSNSVQTSWRLATPLTSYSIDLGDKSYHDIFESLFSLVLREKPTFYDKRKKESMRKAAGARLTKCASAIRVVAARGASKLSRKTLSALIDHITQVLPDPDGDFVQPLIQDYVKALAEVLSRQSAVEYLARKDAGSWELCVDFLLDIAAYIVPNEAHSSLISAARSSPAPGTSTPLLTHRSSNSTQSQKRTGSVDADPLRDALEGLQYLIQASNAPVARCGRNVTGLALRVLNMKHLSLGSMQKMCFSICNTIFARTQADDVGYCISLVRNLLPLMSYWWRAEKVSQDELIKGLRNEISKTIYLAHPHIEHISSNWNDEIRNEIESLVDPLWQEYSKRGEAFRLQLHDLTFNPSTLPAGTMQLSVFGIRNHNSEGESHWALVQNLAFLESILLQLGGSAARSALDGSEQPRKRQRTREHLSRLRIKLRSRDAGTQRTALQLLPFLVEGLGIAGEDLTSILDDLVTYVSDKNPITASWALVASAR